ncbi:MAG: FeoC-like transcriptional regulator [Propioniciclava sp.]
MTGPLSRVLAELTDGVGSLAEVSRRTGLGVDVVQASVDHLVRMGRLQADTLAAGCPGGGCGVCPAAAAEGGRCGGGAAAARGPVLLTLGTR